MRALVTHEPGPPESLVLADVPVPVPGPGQVLVRVLAAALNFPDVLLIEGNYQVPIERPFTPGVELAGEVVALGPEVTAVAVGDRVAATVVAGALAEQAVVDVDTLVALPASVDASDAAALGVVFATAWGALVQVAHVQPGDVVLVLGAAGGVGAAAVQLALALGADVVAAASTQERVDRALAAGATSGIAYGTEDLRTRLKELAPRGVDVVIDPVGGPLAEQALRSCSRGGRFVTLGYASGEIPRIPLNLVLLKDVTICAYDVRAERELHPSRLQDVRREVYGMLAEGRVAPDVSEVLALSEAVGGLRRLADREAVGKLVVDPQR